MRNIKRIEPSEARQHVISGAILVCAYENEELFLRNPLEGAISLQEFQSRLETFNKSQELLFYCA